MCSRYALYTKTRLGYMYYKRQMKKARELYPTGHSTAQPLKLNGLQLLLIGCIFGPAETILVFGYLLLLLVFFLNYNCIITATKVTVDSIVLSNQKI